MAQAALREALAIIQTLSADELEQVQQAVQERLEQQGKPHARKAFHLALLASALVKALKAAPTRKAGDRPLVPIQGEPLSETICEERR